MKIGMTSHFADQGSSIRASDIGYSASRVGYDADRYGIMVSIKDFSLTSTPDVTETRPVNMAVRYLIRALP